MTVTLATAIPEERCRRLNLGYADPATIDLEALKGREGEGILVVPRAGERLYKVRASRRGGEAPLLQGRRGESDGGARMTTSFAIRPGGAFDFVALGALVHRLDPGLVPFRKATECRIHVSGGEFNCAANLADCFRMKTAIVSAMVDSPIGGLIEERVRAMGVAGIYRRFENDGVTGPNMATVYSDRGFGVRPPVVFYNRANEAAARLAPGDVDWDSALRLGREVVPQRRDLRRALPDDGRADRRGDEGGPRRRGASTSFDLNFREKLWKASGGVERAVGRHPADRRERRRPRRERGRPPEGARHRGTRGRLGLEARPGAPSSG